MVSGHVSRSTLTWLPRQQGGQTWGSKRSEGSGFRVKEVKGVKPEVKGVKPEVRPARPAVQLAGQTGFGQARPDNGPEINPREIVDRFSGFLTGSGPVRTGSRLCSTSRIQSRARFAEIWYGY